MNRARGASFALHFLDNRNIAPNVLHAGRGPFVGELRHRRGRGDRINRAYFVDTISHVRDGGVAVHCCRPLLPSIVAVWLPISRSSLNCVRWSLATDTKLRLT